MKLTFLNSLCGCYNNFNTKIYCQTRDFLNANGNLCLFVVGSIMLVAGLGQVASAQGAMQYSVGGDWNQGIVNAIAGVFHWLDGGFGALIMIGAGLMAIVTAAMGAYKAAMACLVIAAGTFILRSFAKLFFPQVMGSVENIRTAGHGGAMNEN